MIFTVVDPGYTWWPWLFGLIPVGIMAAGLWRAERHNWSTEFGGLLFTAGFMLTFFFCLGYGMGGASLYDTQYNAALTEGIESFGFSHVDLSLGKFTAESPDGEFFRGVIERVGDDTYEILELSR